MWRLPIRASNLLPSVLLQIDSAAAIEPHTLRLQPRALLVVAGRGTQTDLAARVDDAVPRHAFRRDAHRPADGARRARRAEGAGDLSIRDDASARYSPHERVDAREERVGRGLMRRNSDRLLSNARMRVFHDAGSAPSTPDQSLPN